MSVADGFARAMYEDPEDHQTPFIFADWLEEQLDPRAELVRIQAALESWVPDLHLRRDLRTREKDLVGRLEASSLGALRQLCDRWDLSRGMVRVSMTAHSFLDGEQARQMDQLLREGWVQEVRLSGLTPGLIQDLAAAEHLGAVTALDLGGARLTNDDLCALLLSPHLGRLTHLNLANNDLSSRGAAFLAQCPHLRSLVSLDLRNNRITAPGLQAILKSPCLGGLRTLEAHGNDLPAPSLVAAARWQEERGCPLRRGPLPRRITSSVGMELVLIPAGSFLMGSPDTEMDHRDNEAPVHPVTITRPFYLGVYQVTQRQFQLVMGRNPATFRRSGGGGPDHPVERVSRQDVTDFCTRLGQLPEEQAAGRRYRLPTEAEWEHACRAGAELLPYHFGHAFSSYLANFDGGRPYGNAPHGAYLQRTTRVGSYRPNAFGLYDMHGNVWEWCLDGYDKNAYRNGPRKDPLGLTTEERGVLRGGSWHSDGPWCRSAYRCSDSFGSCYSWNGFRVLLETGPH